MTALENVTDGVLIVDGQQKVVFANPAARQILNSRLGGATSVACYHLLQSRSRTRRRVCVENCAVLMRSRKGEAISPQEVEIATREGDAKHVSMSIFYYRDRRDESLYIVHFFRQIKSMDGGRSMAIDIAEDLNNEGNLNLITSQGKEALRRFADLTPRQREVLWHLLHGEGTEGIAEILSISINTTRNHIQQVLQRLDVHSRTEAVAYVMQHDLFNRWRQIRWW
jgi:DNA-binding CsgD family transcriptional regulator